MRLGRKTHRIRGKVPTRALFDSILDSLRWTPFSIAITKWSKIDTKTDSWFQKSNEDFGQLQASSGKSKKLKFDKLFLS